MSGLMHKPNTVVRRTPKPTGPAMTEATAELLPLISRLAEINETVATLEAEAKTLKAHLRAAIPIGDPVTVNGNPVLQIQPNRRFNPDLAKTHLSPDLLELCTVQTIDSSRAKALLPPALYAQCMKEYEPKVVFV